MNNLEIRSAVSIAILFMVRMLGLFAILPVLPLVADKVENSTPLLIGIAVGIYGLSQAILQIPMGLLSDQFGRKCIIVLGLGIFIMGSLIAGFSNDIYSILFGRLLQGCGAIASTLFALISDLTRIEHRSKAMAIIGVGIAGSFGLSVVIGPALATWFGHASIFLFSAVTGVIGILLVWKVIPTPTVIKTNLNTAVVTEKLRSILFNPALIPIYVGVMFLHFFLTSGFLVFPLLLKGIGINEAVHSIYYLGILLASAIIMSPFIWLSDRKGHSKSIMSVSIVLMFASLTGLGMNNGYFSMLILILGFFVAFNLLEILLPAHVSRSVAAGTRGTGMGVYSTFQFTGTFLGGLVGGMILTVGDITHVMYVNGAICLLWFILSLKLQNLNSIESRTINFDISRGVSANSFLEGLSSMGGVLDVVLVEKEGVAYLKVDSTSFDEKDLQYIGITGTGDNDGTGNKQSHTGG